MCSSFKNLKNGNQEMARRVKTAILAYTCCKTWNVDENSLKLKKGKTQETTEKSLKKGDAQYGNRDNQNLCLSEKYKK